MKADVKIHKREQQGIFTWNYPKLTLLITDKDKDITKLLKTHRGGFFCKTMVPQRPVVTYKIWESPMWFFWCMQMMIQGLEMCKIWRENMCRDVGGFDFCQKAKENDKRVNAFEYLVSKVNTNKENSDYFNILVLSLLGDTLNRPVSSERRFECSKTAHLKLTSYFGWMQSCISELHEREKVFFSFWSEWNVFISRKAFDFPPH